MRNKYVWYSILANIIIVFGAIQVPFVRHALNIVPMNLNEWVVILSVGLSFMVVVQLAKVFKLFKSNK